MNIWKALLNLKTEIEQYEEPVAYCYLNYVTSQIHINHRPPSNDHQILLLLEAINWTTSTEIPIIRIEKLSQCTFFQTKNLSNDHILFLKKYLPYCFLSISAKQKKRAITIAHFAQTLDGKIATNNGHSKWIGNQENLLHAHRMRALCQGVLVGSQTLKHDEPKLTVRHVTGKHPSRIIIGHPTGSFASLLEDVAVPIIVIHNRPIPLVPTVQYYQLDASNKDWMNPQAILALLYQLGIHSVYIEGGAKTTSHFLNHNRIDILQLHIAPLLFGSGKSGITLPTIQMVQEAHQFDYFHFQPFGDSMMFTGFLKSFI